ncbi:Hypothetical protein A7982_06806 [Minicystis rosea]|nr:Hypothetical protein A7982_06806 [Minicystis rosea]
MRNLIFSAAALVAIALSGCGGSSLDCNALCQKTVECNSSQKVDECMTTCASYGEILDDSYTDALQSCSSQSCDQYATCSANAAKQCTGDPSAFFGEYCKKLSACDPQITEELCQSQISGAAGSESLQFLKCLSDSTFADLGSCIQGASCSTINADLQACVEDVTGIVSMDDVQSGGSSSN